MTPRRTRAKKRTKASAEDEESSFSTDLVVAAPPGWQVRAVQPLRATKVYRCPGCNQEIRPGTQHVVAWRDADEEGRRHWHTPCWKRFARTR